MRRNLLTSRAHRRSISALSLLLLAGTLLTGCGYPAVQPVNQKLLVSLRTALSAKNETWLKANEEQIQARHAEGTMSDAEFATFTALIEQARSGDWEGAERAVVKFQRAQRPTDEQIQAARPGAR